jgi:NADPH:quinone reductase
VALGFWLNTRSRAAKHRGIKVIADAKAADAELVRGYGADIVIERGPGFAEAIRRELPNGADALLDTALLGEESFGAIRDEGIYIPVRGWGDKPAGWGIEIKPMRVSNVLERTEWLELLRDLVAAEKIKLLSDCMSRELKSLSVTSLTMIH